MHARKNIIATLAGRKTLRVAGLMSGTSADGIDVAIADITARKATVLAFDTFAYPPAVRKAIFRLFQPAVSQVDEICHMNFVLGELFADAVITLANRSGLGLSSIDLIGSHGQTIYHIPTGRRMSGPLSRRVRSTFQIAEPSVIAERTGITTVADFRPRDIAAGGLGAPLVPFADYFLFRHARKGRAIQNIGGIANVTYLPPGGGIESVLAFDTGPGNMIIDRVTCLATGGKMNFDVQGKLSRRGKVVAPLLARLMRHAFLRRKPPKTTGREDFGTQFTDKLYARAMAQGLAPLDVLATVTAFTAASITQAYRRYLGGTVDEVILCGGGEWNKTLVEMITQQLAPARVCLMSELGIDGDAKEALSFAILARQTILGLANNVPSATGADHAAVCGKIIPGRIR
ncbi:MAG: anhydro-N-acetylmuramic acid kinase [Phycisphaerae bacterium]